MRPVNKSLYQHNQVIYNPYRNAKNDLILTLGEFCSYCERQGFSTALEIEHIKDKDTYPSETFKWNNFLLACKNCNTCKTTKPIIGLLLPDRDNTFEVFIYLESGFIKVNPTINDSLKLQAQALLDLVRLDRIPNRNGYTGNDTLWQERKQAWELAQRYLTLFE